MGITMVMLRQTRQCLSFSSEQKFHKVALILVQCQIEFLCYQKCQVRPCRITCGNLRDSVPRCFCPLCGSGFRRCFLSAQIGGSKGLLALLVGLHKSAVVGIIKWAQSD